MQQSGKVDEILNELCRILKYEHMQANQLVFRYGDYGDTFYILVDGVVGVNVPIKQKVIENIVENDSQVAQTINK